tara:strand:+ start:987 stop:3389 length:2403 start_codon:yes stop_codon:yes gene_type:complete
MGIKFQSPIDLSAHRAIRYNSAAQTLVVTVATKTAAHPEYGNGSTSGYVVDGIEGPYLEFTPGNTYKFDQSDNSNGNHPLRFYEDAAKTTAYTTGVTTNGVPGQSGAYTQIVPTTSVPPILYYQCSNHSLMGSYVKFGTGSQGDTYTLSASQDGDNVDILLDAGTGTDSIVQLTAGSNVTLTRNSAQEVTIASSGGGGGSGTVSIEKNVYTGNGSTTTFNTSSAIANENNVQVYIDGVYQSKDNYTTSGSTVTMATAPGNGTSVELIQFVTLSGNIVAVDTFNANGVTTTFNLTLSISDKNNTQVYIDGVYQDKSTYSVNGSNITFSPAPGNGAKVEVVQLKPSTSSTGINSNVFTGDGTTVDFTLSQSLTDENNTFVFIQGVYQEKSTYSIAGTTLTFSTAPQNGYSIEVMAFDSITIGNQSSPGTDWQTAIKTSNFTAAAGDGYFVNTTSSSVTVTLPTPPTVGNEVVIQDYAGTFDTNELILVSSDKIQGRDTNAKCIIENATVRLIYQDTTQGWTADNIVDIPATRTVNFLVIAGGGGAGRNDTYYGGGGGGGGFRSSTDGRGGGQSSDTALQLTPSTNYTVTIGGGGAEGGSGTAKGTTGSDSVFGTITSKGGGGAGAYDTYGDGLDGGSGGGAGGNDQDNTGGSALTSPAISGYDGGDDSGTGNSVGGAGGGGAGSVGANVAGVNGATGGAAKVATITGSNVYYAAGGGGKRGWQGGYGAAGANASGLVNSGDGGGGNDTAAGVSAAGRSGIVIVKYSNAYTLTIGAGLTSSTATSGSDKITTFTAGTGNISIN